MELKALCAAVAATPADFGAAAPSLAQACDRAAKGEATLKALQDSLAAVENGAGLIEWKTGRDKAASLLHRDRAALDAAYLKKRLTVGNAETEALKTKLAQVSTGDGLKEWINSRNVVSTLLESAEKSELDKALEKRTAEVGKAEAEAFKAKVEAAPTREALTEIKTQIDAASALSYGQKNALGSALSKKETELRKAEEKKAAEKKADEAKADGGAP
jgi:hypothetical protein